MMVSRKLKVSRAQLEDAARGVVRLNNIKDYGARRFDVLKITHGDQHLHAIVLPHNKAGEIWLSKEARIALGVKEDQTFDLKIERQNWFQRVWWYTWARDPAIHIPAHMSWISIALGVAGLVLGVVSLCK